MSGFEQMENTRIEILSSEYRQKLEKIRAGGLEKLAVISDFDGTLLKENRICAQLSLFCATLSTHF